MQPTKRESEVLYRLSHTYKVKETALSPNISFHAIDTHRKFLNYKLRAKNHIYGIYSNGENHKAMLAQSISFNALTNFCNEE